MGLRLLGSISGQELAYAELTVVTTTTNVTAGDTSTTSGSGGIMITTATIVGAGRPVEIEFFLPGVKHSVAGTYVSAYIIANSDPTVLSLAAMSSPVTSSARGVIAKRRMVLTAGASYTFQGGLAGSAAGTSSAVVGPTFPAYLAVTQR
jgi:hypothetical protein